MSFLRQSCRPHFLVPCFSVFATASAALLLVVLLRPAPGVYLRLCTASTCDGALDFIEAMTDPDVSPCHDFYGHVCNKWITFATESGAVDFVNKANIEFFASVHNHLLASGADTAHHQNRPHALEDFYRVCQSFMRSSEPSLTDVVLPLVNEGNIQHISNFGSLVERLIELSLGRGIDTIFGVKLIRLGKHPLLRLSQATTLTQKMGEQEPTLKVLSYLSELLKKALAIMSTAKASLDDVVKLEHTLMAEVKQSGVEQSYRVRNLGSLCQSVDAARWLRIINDHLENAVLTQDMAVLADNFESVGRVIRIFGNLPDFGIVYVYMQILMSVASFDYRRRHNMKTADGIRRICIAVSQDIMSREWNQHLSYMADQTRNRNTIIAVFRQVIARAAGTQLHGTIGAYERDETVRIFSEASLRLQPRSAEHFPPRNGGFGKVNFSEGFARVYLSLKQTEREKTVEVLPLEHEELINRLLLDGHVRFSSHLNSLVVPVAMRRPPMAYPDGIPIEYAIGTLGVLMSKELYRAVLNDGFKSENWSQNIWKGTNNSYDCLERLSRSSFGISLGMQSDVVSRELYIWIRSARFAYEALRDRLWDHRDARNWNTYWKAAQKTFFWRFCLLSCSADERPRPLLPKLGCILPLANMMEFGDVFGCSTTSPMGGNARCSAA